MRHLLDDIRFPNSDLNLATRQYFEVISCDEIDIYIYLFGFSKKMIKRTKIEGQENFEKTLGNKGGGIFLSAHFGGGFWILPFLKEKGVKAHFFSIDIERQNYPLRSPLYFYHQLRNWVVKKASGEIILFKKGGKEELTQSLMEGKWLIVLFDVPPSLVKDNQEVTFLGRKAWFPKGIINIAKEMNLPLLPFFSFLDGGGKHRKICFEEPLYVQDENEGVERSVRLIEQRILERPDHWHFWPIADQFFTI